MNLRKSCVHLKEKKFKCNECLQRFNRKHHLISYSRIHSKEKPFVCNYKECDKNFSDKSLIQHIETHLGIKRHKFYFNECDISFVTLTKLKQNLNIHLKEK
jgi:uncharacterized Zn-finger protein